MKRIPKFLMALLASFTLAALPASAEKLSLSAISKYLNGMKTAQSPFTQFNDDGTISTGTVYIKRPGRMRFEYNPPDKTLVLAGGGAVAIFDGKSNTSAETYPLKRTPLNIILARNVNLGRARMVTAHSYEAPATIVTAQDPEHPEYGNIQLVFTSNPIELRQWKVNDDSGSQTTVVLGELRTGVGLRDGLFSIQQHIQELER